MLRGWDRTKEAERCLFDSFFDAQYRMPTILRFFLCRFFRETTKQKDGGAIFLRQYFSLKVCPNLSRVSICPSSRGEKNRGRQFSNKASDNSSSTRGIGDNGRCHFSSLPQRKAQEKFLFCQIWKTGANRISRGREDGCSAPPPPPRRPVAQKAGAFVVRPRQKKMRDDDLFLGGKRRAAAEKEEGSGAVAGAVAPRSQVT